MKKKCYVSPQAVSIKLSVSVLDDVIVQSADNLDPASRSTTDERAWDDDDEEFE